MSGSPATVETSAGPLTVAPLSPEALQGLREMFPAMGTYEQDGRELLALCMVRGERRMYGLRTGYGWFEGEKADTARRAALFGRMRLPGALAAFRARGLDGAVLAAACVADNGSGPVQEGELLFMHARTPLVGGMESEPLPTWERFVGEHTTAALLTLIGDVNASWNAAGIATRTLTDLEPCPVDSAQVRWFADVVLVGGRVVLVRPALDPRDPILGALVAAGIGEVEFTPSAFLLADAAAAAGDVK